MVATFYHLKADSSPEKEHLPPKKKNNGICKLLGVRYILNKPPPKFGFGVLVFLIFPGVYRIRSFHSYTMNLQEKGRIGELEIIYHI